MNLIDFLLERQCDDAEKTDDPIKLREIAFRRKILDFHQSWPVLVEERPTFKVVERDGDLKDITGALTMEMQVKYQWMIAEDYRKVFGLEPPSAPILKEMAKLYSDHPDFNPDWL